MKRLIKKNHVGVREPILMVSPLYPSFPEQQDSQFQESDDKSYSRMINEHTIELQKEREEVDTINKYRLDKNMYTFDY